MPGVRNEKHRAALTPGAQPLLCAPMPEIAYVNGEFRPLAEATINVEDRGFQFADAVYEVLRTYDGELFAVDEHLDRLDRSLAAIDLQTGLSRVQLTAVLQEIVRRGAFPETMVYMQISRGVAPRHRGPPAQATPTVVITVRPLPPAPAQVSDVGATVITVADERWARCDIKCVGLLANVMAYQAAKVAGADDAVFVDADGSVAESTAGNIFIVRQGQILTPPKGPRILSGVTRDKMLAAACGAGIVCREEPFSQAELLAADEVFLTSTTVQVVPVIRVNGQSIGSGKCGPVTERVYAEFYRRLPRRERVRA